MNDERAREPPDLAALAKRFLDLWQEQVTALAGDPELARGMGRLLGALPPGFPFWHGAAGHDPGSVPDWSPAAAGASRGRERRLDDVAARLDAVEKRLARLEADAGAKRRAPARKPRKGSG